MTEVAHRACEIANVAPDPFAPYVGSAAFAHKAGLHAAAVDRLEGAYEHVRPESVGNVQRVLISELSGRGNCVREPALLVSRSAMRRRRPS